MDGDAVLTVLQRIILRDGRAGQLAVLADQEDARVQRHGERGGKQEAARLDPGDQIDGASRRGDHPLHGARDAGRVEQQGCDVAELDAGLGEVRDRADQGFQVVIRAHAPRHGPMEGRGKGGIAMVPATIGGGGRPKKKGGSRVGSRPRRSYGLARSQCFTSRQTF